MRAYGPFAQTPGNIIHVQTAQNQTDCFIKNVSPYDLWISFDPMQPPVIPFSSQIQLPYVESIPAFHALPVGLPRGDDYPWAGNIWLLPQAPGGLSVTGATSPRANAYITTYEKNDKIPQAYAEARQADITSQQRVVTLPISDGGSDRVVGAKNCPSGTGVSVDLDAVSWTVNNLIGNSMVFYFYWWDIGLTADATAAGFINASLNLDLRNNTNVSLGFPWPVQLARKVLNWPAAAGPYTNWQFGPGPLALAIVGLITTGADHLVLTFKSFTSSANVPGFVVYNLVCYPLFNSGGLAIPAGISTASPAALAGLSTSVF